MKKPKHHRAQHASGLFDELVIDNFAGGGGASLGIERALGRAVDVAINHSRDAVAMHQANHPATLHHCEDVWHAKPAEIAAGRPVGLCWFSPDCRHFSNAKGGKPVQKKIRGLAWVVVRWAKRVQPRVIMLENVREFLTWGPLGPDDRPCPIRKGVTFKRWVGQLRSLGYAVEWKILNAADFGAPTNRKRLFLVARRDGEPIVWPEPTHGPGRGKPHRAAAECIDWSIPCPSIFLTKEEAKPLGLIRPLAEKTMRRIAMGVRRYVLENPRPFLVQVNHGGDDFRGQEADAPLPTVTGRHGFGVVAPFVVAQHGERDGQPPRTHGVGRPWPTVTPQGFVLASAYISKYFGGVVGSGVDRPLGTVTAIDHNAVVAANLVQYNGQKGNEVRGKGLGDPINTVTGDPRFALVSSHLTKFYGTSTGSAMTEPAPTVTGQGNHVGEVRAFLTKYYGTRSVGQGLADPLHTVTGADRFGLVTIAGEPYQIVDIGLRMLRPRELYRAQGFPDDYVIAPIVRGKAMPVSAQVKLCGNSVPPQLSEALVRANFATEAAPKRRRKAVLA